jgi:hypothetical protein
MSTIVTARSITPPKRLGVLRRHRVATGAFVTLLFLGVVIWFVAAWVDRDGLQFFATGKATVGLLHDLAAALQKRDFRAVEALYSPGFRGRALGVTDLRLAEERDGIRTYRFHSSGETADRAAAVAEWQAYLARFAAIESVEAHIHLLDQWDAGEDVVASVRFELIGTPVGERQAGIDRAFFKLRFARTASGLAIRQATLVSGDRVIGDRPHFEDVAKSAGVDFMNRYYPAFLNQPLKFVMLRFGPAGISAVDYDDDGWYDLFIPDGVESKLFRNRHDGTFEDVTARAGLSGLDGVSTAIFADYDNDGHKDLFVSRTFKPNQLFHNNGDGTYTDVTAKAGVGADCCTTAASWADYDNDGKLDLYVGRYLDPRKAIPTTFYARDGEPNQLYHNNGDGTFTNVTRKAGVGEPGLCLGTVFGDYNDDGWPDLYVVNDFGRNTLYRNNRDGTFKDVSKESNTLAYGAGMSASFGDYDNDGKLDIYVANIRSEERWFGEMPTVRRYMLTALRQGVLWQDLPVYYEIYKQSGFSYREVFQQMGSGNSLLHNKGDGTFDDVSWKAGANPPGWFWGSGFADFDNDGWQDIYSANGWVYADKGTDFELDFFGGIVADQKKYKTGWFYDPKNFGTRSWHGWERNRFLRNNKNGTFSEIGRGNGTDLIRNSRGIAVADFWNRGVLDIAVAASTDRHALLKNEIGGKRNWLAVELTGAAGALPKGTNRDAVGARVTVKAGGLSQIREVALGDGYGSQNSLRLYFGLDQARQVDELKVLWPRSGRVQTWKAVPAGRILAIAEGKDELVEKRYGTGR